jgi:acetyl esterase/lipase
VSPEAKALLALGPLEGPNYPSGDDVAEWQAVIAVMDELMRPMLVQRASQHAIDVDEIEADGVRVFATSADSTAEGGHVYLQLHGGGFIIGGGECCRASAVDTAARVGKPVWAVDYRMPPTDPYPAALDDCITAYRALLRLSRPEEIVIGGDSAGGNLAASLILRARDEGLPLPAAAVLISPELDLTESGDSFRANLGVDTVLTRSQMPANLLYAAGHDLAHPYLSPLFGDVGQGFPPTLLATGTRDLFLSNTVRMHRALRAAGVHADLHVFEAAPHGGFLGMAPEDAELDREVRRFVEARLAD